MTEPDAYFHVDKLRAECEKHSEAYSDWLEDATLKILERWKAELTAEDHITDLDYDGADITALGVERQLPFDKVLFDLAWKHADESGLYEKLSWS